MKRSDGRKFDQLRPVKIRPNYLKQPHGSVLIEMGQTRVVCAVSVEEGVPRWKREQGVGGGWISAEYSMLPYSTSPRKPREISRGKPEGRTQEIQRLIGRSLRAVIDLSKLGERTAWVDCDVLQADGGTRTAAITGSFVAFELAVKKLQKQGMIQESPTRANVAAVSVGLLNGKGILDLCYEEDASADVDMNVIMTDGKQLVELQATGEEATFSQSDLTRLLKLAGKGISELLAMQQKLIS